jgi:protein TonB
VQGDVVIEATIDEEGKVADAHVVKSVPLLDQAALDAVRQWQYRPSLLNGIPTAVVTTVTVKFTLP